MDKARRAVLGDGAGRRRGVPRGRLPVRAAGAAAGGPVPRARHLRARRGDAAAPEVQGARALDRRRAGHRHRQARRARFAAGCRSTRTSGSTSSRSPSTVVMFVLGWNLLRGRVGRALVAIRDQPIAAEAMGVNTALYKSLDLRRVARCTPASPARSARSRCSSSRPTASTSSCRSRCWSASSSAGWPRSPGALYGALFIQFVPNIADEISKAAPWAIFGVFLIAFMYLMPTRRRRARAAARAAARRRRNGDADPPSSLKEETCHDHRLSVAVRWLGAGAAPRRRSRRRSTTRARPTPRSRSATPSLQRPGVGLRHDRQGRAPPTSR